MGLVIWRNGSRDVPAVHCDYCGHIIERASEGNYQWIMVTETEPVPTAVVFTHKLHCSHAYEEANPLRDGELWGAISLECLPVYLVGNLDIDWKHAQSVAALMSRM